MSYKLALGELRMLRALSGGPLRYSDWKKQSELRSDSTFSKYRKRLANNKLIDFELVNKTYFLTDYGEQVINKQRIVDRINSGQLKPEVVTTLTLPLISKGERKKIIDRGDLFTLMDPAFWKMVEIEEEEDVEKYPWRVPGKIKGVHITFNHPFFFRHFLFQIDQSNVFHKRVETILFIDEKNRENVKKIYTESEMNREILNIVEKITSVIGETIGYNPFKELPEKCYNPFFSFNKQPSNVSLLKFLRRCLDCEFAVFFYFNGRETWKILLKYLKRYVARSYALQDDELKKIKELRKEEDGEIRRGHFRTPRVREIENELKILEEKLEGKTESLMQKITWDEILKEYEREDKEYEEWRKKTIAQINAFHGSSDWILREFSPHIFCDIAEQNQKGQLFVGDTREEILKKISERYRKEVPEDFRDSIGYENIEKELKWAKKMGFYKIKKCYLLEVDTKAIEDYEMYVQSEIDRLRGK